MGGPQPDFLCHGCVVHCNPFVEMLELGTLPIDTQYFPELNQKPEAL